MLPGDPGRLGTHMHVGVVETSRHVETRHSHLRSYCGNPATREGKTHAFPQLPSKPRDTGRQDTLVYIITVET